MKKFLFELGLKWCCFKSNKIIWFQKTFLRTVRCPKFSQTVEHIKAWKDFVARLVICCCDSPLNIGATERFLFTRTGESGDFALLAYRYFGYEIWVDDHDYFFQGFHCLSYGGRVEHVLAVWKAVNRRYYFVIDNYDAYFTQDPYIKWKTRNSEKLKMVGTIVIDSDEKLYFDQILEN